MRIRFQPYVKELFEIMCLNFKEYPHPAYLYVLECSAEIFSQVEDLQIIMSDAYHYVCEQTFEYFQDRALEQDVDLAEDFFGMLFRYTKYIPNVILSSKTLEYNLALAYEAIGIQKEIDLAKALYLFLEQVFRNCATNPKDQIEAVS